MGIIKLLPLLLICGAVIFNCFNGLGQASDILGSECFSFTTLWNSTAGALFRALTVSSLHSTEALSCAFKCLVGVEAIPFNSSVMAIAAWIIASSAVEDVVHFDFDVPCRTHRGLPVLSSVDLVVVLHNVTSSFLFIALSDCAKRSGAVGWNSRASFTITSADFEA
jgi:hypothetical protein